MSRGVLVAVCLAAGCLSAPVAGDPDADAGPVAGEDGGGAFTGPCKLFAGAPAMGELAGTFVGLDGVLAADLDGDGDRDLVLHGPTPVGPSRLVAARMPQSGPIRFHWSASTAGPVALAAADLVGADGCAELVVGETGGATTPLTILGQEVSGDQIFRVLSVRELEIDPSAGLWLVADGRLGDGDPAVALATPTTLHALPPDALLAGDAVPTTTVPDFAGIRGIALVPRDDHSDLLVAEDGRVRWMEPVLPGGQLQFNPLRVLSLDLDPRVSAGGADLDRDGELDDFFFAGDESLGLILDGSVDPPSVVPATSAVLAGCPPFDGTAVGRLDSGGDRDLVAIDACSDTVSVTVLRDARVAAGPALDGAKVDGLGEGAAAGFAVLDRDGDAIDEVWMFDPTGAATCWAVDGLQLVGCD